ncbi:hypothetical protein [Cryobacterium aureum]|uniref:hypothetical protein n=1 Tax=Cryobacterium aureum TaxID=995037 RepID=UPI000CF3E005|nr:hypothetical protein [Cryobacterium aureum]
MWDSLDDQYEQILFSSWQDFSRVVQGLILAAAIAVVLAALVYRSSALTGVANSLESVLTGVIGVVVLALILDLLLVGLGRLTTPRGIRV